jgi:hypothetical protein
MDNYEQTVFISYAWGGESEAVVNKIDDALQTRGLRITRDKRDLGYKGSIKEFMERIGQGNCVIVVISDKYLRSPNCMYELVEIAKNKNFYDRVFPIVLQDADIYDPVNRVQYIKHWEDKEKALDEAMKTVSSANLQGMREEIDSYNEIRANIANLTFILKDMNTLTPDMHQDRNFSHLYDAIEKRMKESLTAPPSETVKSTKRTERPANSEDNVAATNGSIGIGGIHIGGNVDGNIVIGNNNQVNNNKKK